MTLRHEQPTPGPAMDLAARFQALVPVIETERLVLRAPKLSDFPTCAEIACTERGRYVGGPMSREDAWSEFTADLRLKTPQMARSTALSFSGWSRAIRRWSLALP